MSDPLAGLPSAQLLARVRELVQRGNAVEAELLVHLAEVDARRLYLDEGCSSMFVYCQRVLHFAEGVAYKRIQAARAARPHPKILEAVRRGELHLTALGLLAPKLTDSNCGELIQAARHRSAEEVRQLLADREPRPAMPASVRQLPEPAKRTLALDRSTGSSWASSWSLWRSAALRRRSGSRLDPTSARRMMDYYKAPDFAVVETLLEELDEPPISTDRGTRPPVIGFLAAIFEANPDRVAAILDREYGNSFFPSRRGGRAAGAVGGDRDVGRR